MFRYIAKKQKTHDCKGSRVSTSEYVFNNKVETPLCFITNKGVCVCAFLVTKEVSKNNKKVVTDKISFEFLTSESYLSNFPCFKRNTSGTGHVST